MRKTIKPLVILICLLFSLKTYAQEIRTTLSANEVMILALQKAKDNDQLKYRHLTYIENLVIDEYNYIDEPISKNESNKRITGERRKFAGFNMGIGDLLGILTARDNFSISSPSEVRVNKHLCIAIDFEPKSGLVDDSTEDKFINRIRGKLFIDAEDYNLWRVEAQIPESDTFNFVAHKYVIFFATIEIKRFKLIFEQTEYHNVVVEHKIYVEAKYKAINGTRTRKYNYLYRGYSYK